MSMMLSMFSMSTGHSSTQAPQVVHDHRTSGSMTVPTRFSTSVPAARFFAAVGTASDNASVDLAKQIGSQMDASTVLNDARNNPLGRQSTHYARVVAIRELRSLGWLVSQLSQMP